VVATAGAETTWGASMDDESGPGEAGRAVATMFLAASAEVSGACPRLDFRGVVAAETGTSTARAGLAVMSREVVPFGIGEAGTSEVWARLVRREFAAPAALAARVGFVDWSVESLAAEVPLPSVGPADAVARPGPASESPRTTAAALTRAALFAEYIEFLACA